MSCKGRHSLDSLATFAMFHSKLCPLIHLLAFAIRLKQKDLTESNEAKSIRAAGCAVVSATSSEASDKIVGGDKQEIGFKLPSRSTGIVSACVQNHSAEAVVLNWQLATPVQSS